MISSIVRLTLAISLLCTFMLCSVIKYKHQQEYENFLDMIEWQTHEEENRRERLQEDNLMFNSDIYGIDRHGRPFIKCAKHNSTSSKRINTVRCPRIGDHDRPGCFAMYDAVNDELIQGCYNYPKELAKTCETYPECTLKVLKEKIGFCCCVGDRCNDKSRLVFRGSPLEDVTRA